MQQSKHNHNLCWGTVPMTTPRFSDSPAGLRPQPTVVLTAMIYYGERI